MIGSLGGHFIFFSPFLFFNLKLRAFLEFYKKNQGIKISLSLLIFKN
jgi:hypothetical protein